MKKLLRILIALAIVGANTASVPGVVKAEKVASSESKDVSYMDDISNNESVIKEDSLSISEEIKDNFRVYELYSDEDTKLERRLVQDFESIMRWYNIPIRGAFTEYNNIDDVLVSKYVLRKYYVVEYKDGTIKFYNEQLDEMKSNRYTIIDGKEVLLPFSPISSKAFETFKNQDIVQNNLGSEVKTESVFYMSGETSMMGTAIYYRTSIGDYVYYYHSSIGEKLFPVDDFCKFQQAIKDEYAKYPESGGGVDIANVWDLAKYELKYSSQKTIKGDSNCDGSVDMADAVLIMQALANPNKYGVDGTAEHHLTEQGKLNGDIDDDGLTVGDAQSIQRILLGFKEDNKDNITNELLSDVNDNLSDQTPNDTLGSVVIDGIFYLQTFSDTTAYTPAEYLGNGGDFKGFYQGDTSISFYTAKENEDIIIVMFYDGSQLNLLKEDKKITH